MFARNADFCIFVVEMCLLFPLSFNNLRTCYILRMKRLYSLLFTAVATLSAMAQGSYVPELYGNLLYMDSFESATHDERMGVYSFPASAENFKLTPVATGLNFYANGNGIMDGRNYWFLMTDYDDYYGVEYTQLYRYDMETWKTVGKIPDVDANFSANDFTIDPTTNTVYGICASYTANNELCSMDFVNKKRNKLAAITDSTYMTLAADDAGQMYSITGNGNLVKLDHEANPTYVCSLFDGQQSMADRVQSAAFDYKTGLMYWAAQFWTQPNKKGKLISALYCIDVNKHEMKKIADFPDNAQIVSLYVKQNLVADGAPAAPMGVGKDFAGGSLSGNITFTAPSTTASGTALSGELGYEVTIDNQVLATGKTQPGAKVSAPVTIGKEGTTRFLVSCSNAEGKGKEVAYTTYIGFDDTSVPENVKTEFDDKGNVKLTWDAPDSTLNGGFFDKDALKYDVVCHRLEKPAYTVAENLQSRQFSLTLPADEYVKYSFGVVAVNDTHRSAEAIGSDFAYGPAIDVTESAPYSEDFSTISSFSKYTSLDLNGDKTVRDFSSMGFIFYYGFWGYSTKYDGAAIYYNADSGKKADDWLLTPMLNLKAGEKYNLEFQMWRESNNVTDLANVSFGEGFDPTAYTPLLETFVPDVYAADGEAPTIYKKQFVPAADGKFMIGFHITSDPYKGANVYLDNVKLSVEKATAITNVDADKPSFDVYSMSGVLVRKDATSLSGLPKGVYVAGGKKIIKR